MKQPVMASGALTLMIGKGLCTVITTVTPFLLVRTLSQDEFGLYKQIFLIYATLVQVLPFGLVPSLYYFLAIKKDKRTSYVLNTQVVVAIITVTSGILLVLFKETVARVVGNAVISEYSIEIALYSGLMVLSASTEAILIVDGYKRPAAIVSVASEVLKSFGLLVPVLLFRDLHVMMWVLIGVGVVRCIGLTGYLAGSRSADEQPLTVPERKEQLVYSAPFGMAVVLMVLQASLDKYVVSSTAGVVGFAIYSVGMFQLPLVAIMQQSFAEATLPEMARAARHGTAQEVISIWHSTAKYLALVFIPASMLLFVIRNEFIEVLFTDAYKASIPIFSVAVFALPLNAILPDGVLRAYGDTKKILLITCVSCLAMGVLVYPLIELAGLAGAAMSWLLSLALNRYLLLLRSSQLLGIGFRELLPWKTYGTVWQQALIAAVIVEAMKSIVQVSAHARLTLGLALFLAIYAALLLRSNLIQERHREMLNISFQRMRGLVIKGG
ncbi:lipopolysaccharide biosynthesis protein [Candidatus Nitrospira bockiana]